MSWRFVVSHDQVHGEDVYAVREYYVDLPGSSGPAWTADAIAPQGGSRDDLIVELRRMLAAAESGEVLDLARDEPQMVTAEEVRHTTLDPDWS